MSNMKINIWLVILAGLIGFASCSKQEVKLYEQNGGMRFQKSPSNNYIKNFSFAEVGGAETAIIEIPALISGLTSDRFELLEGTVPIDSIWGTAKIKLHNSEILDVETRSFFVKIVPSDDFPLSDLAINNYKISFTSKLIRPATWDGYLKYFFGDYSKKWHEFIISVTKNTNINSLTPENGVANMAEGFWPLETRKKFYITKEISQARAKLRKALAEYKETHGEFLTHDNGEIVTF